METMETIETLETMEPTAHTMESETMVQLVIPLGKTANVAKKEIKALQMD